MEREEPSSGLVNAFGNEVGGEKFAGVYSFFMFERVVLLGERHGAAVEPHVDQVSLAVHGLAGFSHEYDMVHVWAVEVDFLVIVG